MPYKFLYLVVFVLLSGCGVASTHPLTDPLTAEPDKSLYGHWVGKPTKKPLDGSEIHLFIGTSGKQVGKSGGLSPFMEIAGVLWGGDELQTIWASLSSYATVSRIGKSSYVNLYGILSVDGKLEGNLLDSVVSPEKSKWEYKDWENHPRKFIMILRYVVQGNRLTIWPASEDDKKQKILLEAGELQQGERIFPGSKTTKEITYDSLFRYLRSHDGGVELFGEATTFTKVP